ncbi:MAG: protoglobin family protein [Planctomycetota bacterium]
MQRIDEPRLETDLAYRFGYVAEFVGFDEEDIAVIHASAPLLAPLVPTLVDAVYDKLFGYDSTKRHFVPRQHGYDGEVPTDLESLTVDHPMIAFRKNHLGNYLKALVTREYDGKMAAYLDLVGEIHTPGKGNPQLNIPLVQMNVLLGFVADAFVATITALDLDRDTEVKALRAFTKLLWIQNDLINRHYVGAPTTAAAV